MTAFWRQASPYIRAVALVFAVWLAVSVAYVVIAWGAENPPATTAAPTGAAAEASHSHFPKQGKVWVCPMHPEIVQDHPGKCPICGMDLVESGSGETHEHGVSIDAGAMQKIGVRLARAKMSVMHKEIRTYGNVVADGSGIYNIHSFFDGIIQKSYVTYPGQKIRKGQVLYEIYSPELNTQQQELLKYIGRRKEILQNIPGDTVMYENEYVMDLLEELSRERTKFLYEGVGIDTLKQLEDRRRVVEVVPILAAESGVVMQINARAGSKVSPDMLLFSLTNTAQIRVEAALYPDQADSARAGDAVVVKLDGMSPMRGRVEYINPLAENNKITARITVESGDRPLRSGAYADVRIQTGAHDALTLPRSAILYTGDGSMVMLSRGDGHFLPVPVETGMESGDEIEIVDGLVEGAEVAVNGQFLLDAASSMNAARERMHSDHHD